MLDLVRSKQKSILIKFAFGLIILSFVIGYTMLTAPNESGSGRNNDVAARVNGDDISYSAFQNSYSNLYNLYQRIYQGKFDANVEKQLNLPKQALRQLIDELLLVQEAERRGLNVSKDELVKSIAQYDAFKQNGVFNRARYLQVLSYQRMTPEQFETSQRRQLLTQKVRDQLQQGVSVTEEEMKAAYHKEKDQVDLNYCWVTPALVEAKVKVTDKGLLDYFMQNQEQFRIPEKISLRYLQFNPAGYEKEVAKFSDDELKRYYRRHLDMFETKAKVKAAHILLRVAKGADADTRQKQRELAEELLKKLRQGADFAKLARTYSEDKGTAKNGGELGYFGRGTMIGSFEDAAFKLQPGQLSNVVETPFGFHIIKVEESIEAGVKPLVDVIDEVKTGLVVEKSRQIAYEKAMDAYNINRKTGDLAAAAKSNDLGIKETGLFSRGETIDGIGKEPAISQAAFRLQVGKLGRPLQTPQGVFLFTLKERQPSRLPELDEVRASVELAYRTSLAQDFAEQLAEQLLKKAQELKSLRKAAAELKLTVEETGPFSRSYGAFIPRIGSVAKLAKEAFSLTKDNPVAPQVYSVNNKYLVAGLKKAEQADFNSLDNAARTQLHDQLLTAKKDAAVTDKLRELIAQAQIEVMVPELINSFAAGSKQ